MRMFFGKQKPIQEVAGTPGVKPSDAVSDEMSAHLLTRKETQKVIGEKDIKSATRILSEYKRGKTNLEDRIVKDEMWWKVRHWEVINSNKNSVTPSSAWLFNSILNKHADAMDNFPEPIVLPREKSDEESAKKVTKKALKLFQVFYR